MSDRAERRWTVWECDCGNLNQASFPGMQHPCWACNHPATIDCDEVCPVSELDALREERDEWKEQELRQFKRAEAAEQKLTDLVERLTGANCEEIEDILRSLRSGEDE